MFHREVEDDPLCPGAESHVVDTHLAGSRRPRFRVSLAEDFGVEFGEGCHLEGSTCRGLRAETFLEGRDNTDTSLFSYDFPSPDQVPSVTGKRGQLLLFAPEANRGRE